MMAPRGKVVVWASALMGDAAIVIPLAPSTFNASRRVRVVIEDPRCSKGLIVPALAAAVRIGRAPCCTCRRPVESRGRGRGGVRTPDKSRAFPLRPGERGNGGLP